MMIFWIHWLLIHAVAVFFAYALAHYACIFFQSQDNLPPRLLRFERRVFAITKLSLAPMTWLEYLNALLIFQLLGFVIFYLMARMQMTELAHFTPSEAFQLAASYVTNTNFLSLPGERYWSQPLYLFGIIYQSFVSAATGIAILLVMARAFVSDKTAGLGNFWQDIWRTSSYVLLPLASVFSLFLIAQGVPQNWQKSLDIVQYENPAWHQSIPMGPIAIHESIKLLGSNGAGLTQANSAHPFENPSALTSFFESVAVLIIPVYCCFLFGFLLKNKRYAWSIWGIMFVLSTLMAVGGYLSQANSLLGVEMRIGLVDTIIFQALNTATATGASMGILDWMSSLSNGCYLLLMNLGEICFGGCGMGLVNMLVVLLLAAFILNLLSGQSANFLNKSIPLSVMKLAIFYIIFAPCLILMVLSVLLFQGQIPAHQPDSLTAWWYALSSWVQNNGGAYVGGIASGSWVDYLSGAMMLIGRFFPMMMALAMAGIIDKQSLISTQKTLFSLNSLLFCGLAMVVIVLVTLLAFLPLWSFGPLAGI